MDTKGIQRLDVIQINPQHDTRFGGCFMVVTKLTPDGAYGFIDIPPGAKVIGEKNGMQDLDIDTYRAFYICPYDQCMKIGVAEWVPEDEREEKKSPFVGFSADRLAKCPPCEVGDKVECLECGGEHELVEHGDNPHILFYECQGQIKVGGLSGRLIVNIQPTFGG